MPFPASRSCNGCPSVWWGVRRAPTRNKGLESPSAGKEEGDTLVWGRLGWVLSWAPRVSHIYSHTRTKSWKTQVENLRTSGIPSFQDLKDLSCIWPLSNTQCVIEVGESWWHHGCKLLNRLYQESFEETYVCLHLFQPCIPEAECSPGEGGWQWCKLKLKNTSGKNASFILMFRNFLQCFLSEFGLTTSKGIYCCAQ